MKTIKLLDGSIHNIKELEDNMYEDEFYYGYLGKVALSSSSCKLLLDSPKTYHYITKYGQATSQAMRDGQLFHTMILEPEKINQFVFVNVQSKNTKAYKEAKAYHENVFTIKEKQDAERLVDAFHRNENVKKYIVDAQYEVPKIGVIENIPFRAKADVLLNSNGIVDLKTTTDVKNFQISAQKWKYYNQVYIYCELFGIDYENFTFVCIDKKSLDIGVFKCSEEFYLRGKEEVRNAIELYRKFFAEPESLDDYIYEGTL